MAIKITRYNNNQVSEVLESIGAGEDYNYTPDDRLELVQTIQGATLADGGYYQAGDKHGASAVFDTTTLNELTTVWSTRERVTVSFDDGTTLSNAVIAIKNISWYDKYLPAYKKVQFEAYTAV